MSHLGVRRNRRSHLNWHYGGTFLDGRSQRASVLSAILETVHREAPFDGKACNTRMIIVYCAPWDGPKNMIGGAC